jgi:hypothetical protein
MGEVIRIHYCYHHYCYYYDYDNHHYYNYYHYYYDHHHSYDYHYYYYHQTLSSNDKGPRKTQVMGEVIRILFRVAATRTKEFVNVNYETDIYRNRG